MPDIDVASLVGDIATDAITMRTYGPPSIDGFGQPVRGVEADVALTAVVHPATPQQLSRLPEADRVRATISVYTTTPLRTVATGYSARLLYNGAWYELWEQADYGFLGGIYISLASLIDGPLTGTLEGESTLGELVSE